LKRFIATPDTSKHKPFVFVDSGVLPDAQVYCVASEDALHLGVLSSAVHQLWIVRAAPRLGVGNDLRWKPKAVWSTFPFPSDDTGLTPELTNSIRILAEQLDAHRKTQQAAHEAVTLTGLYNVLAKLRSGEALHAKDKLLHEQGLVSVLRSLHDELDAAVLQACGWADLGPVPWGDDAARATWTDSLLERLVALNARRAAEEAQGLVRWLRPELQDPARRSAPAPKQAEIDTGTDTDPDTDTAGAAPASPVASAPRQPWPAELPAQMRAVADLLAATPAALTEAALADRFTGRGPWKKRLPQILHTLEAVGRARAMADAGGPPLWHGA